MSTSTLLRGLAPMTDYSISPPQTLILALQSPPEVCVGYSEWDLRGDFRIREVPVDGNDTPWGVFADLLIDQEDRSFVGLTFEIWNPKYWAPMQEIAKRLDSRVVHYNDLSTADAQRIYVEEAGRSQRFEITWAPARSWGYELAQLCCGQWFWWYAKKGSWGVSAPIVALGVSDIPDLLRAHKLTFPRHLEFPPLRVDVS